MGTIIKLLRGFFGFCNHDWEPTGGMFESYNLFFHTYHYYEQFQCSKCKKLTTRREK